MIKYKKHPLINFYKKVKRKYNDVISIKDLAAICYVSTKTIRRYIKKLFLYTTFSNNTHLIHIDSLTFNFTIPCEKTILKNYSNFGLYPEYNHFLANIKIENFHSDFHSILKQSLIKIGRKKFISMLSFLNSTKNI